MTPYLRTVYNQKSVEEKKKIWNALMSQYRYICLPKTQPDNLVAHRRVDDMIAFFSLSEDLYVIIFDWINL